MHMPMPTPMPPLWCVVGAGLYGLYLRREEVPTGAGVGAETPGNWQRSTANLFVVHNVSLIFAALERPLWFHHNLTLIPASATKAILRLLHSFLTWPGASGNAIRTFTASETSHAKLMVLPGHHYALRC